MVENGDSLFASKQKWLEPEFLIRITDLDCKEKQLHFDSLQWRFEYPTLSATMIYSTHQ